MLTEITLANEQDVDDAYRAAERAQPAWAALPPENRRTVLARAAHILERRRMEIIEWLVHESGSVRAKAAFEWHFTYQGLLEATSYPFHIEGRILPSSIPGKESRVYRGSAGVVGVISPWDFPLHLIREQQPAGHRCIRGWLDHDRVPSRECRCNRARGRYSQRPGYLRVC